MHGESWWRMWKHYRLVVALLFVFVTSSMFFFVSPALSLHRFSEEGLEIAIPGSFLLFAWLIWQVQGAGTTKPHIFPRLLVAVLLAAVLTGLTLFIGLFLYWISDGLGGFLL